MEMNGKSINSIALAFDYIEEINYALVQERSKAIKLWYQKTKYWFYQQKNIALKSGFMLYG